MASSLVTTATTGTTRTAAASAPAFHNVGPSGGHPIVNSSSTSSHRDTTTSTTSRSSSSSIVHPYKQEQKHTKRMICGGIAGMVAKTATNPLERIKMLSQTGETVGGERSIVAIYRQILHKEGILGLWAGNGTNLLRIFPSKAVVFSSHDFYKSLFRQYFVVASPSHGSNSAGQPASAAALPAHFSFLAGGLAGMTATAVTYPLDLARGRISGKLAQSHDGTKAYKGIAQTIATTLHDEGIRGLYRGVTPTLLGAMPYVGIQFGTVGLLEKLFPLSSSSSSPTTTTMRQDANADDAPRTTSTPLRKMMFGGLGGLTAGLLTYPNDTVRRLLQLQGSRGTQTYYRGYWDCVRQTYQEQGIGRFYRGMTVNLIRMAPNTAVQFGTYELLKQWTGAK